MIIGLTQDGAIVFNDKVDVTGRLVTNTTAKIIDGQIPYQSVNTATTMAIAAVMRGAAALQPTRLRLAVQQALAAAMRLVPVLSMPEVTRKMITLLFRLRP